MGVKYLWDTNTAIYYLQQQFSADAELFIDEILKQQQPIISAITEIELLCWKTASGKDIQAIQSFINGAVVIELEQDIKISTAAIRKAHKIKLPDTIIAATALVYNLTLLTRNTSDFKDIKGISLHNPFD
jgi:hypothetical protein